MAWFRAPVNLTNADTGKLNTSEAIHISNEEDLDKYIRRYADGVEEEPYILLYGSDINKRFGAWQLAHDAYLSTGRKEFLLTMFNLGVSTVTGRGVGILTGIGSIYKSIFDDIMYESNHYAYCALSRHYQDRYVDDSTGVCLHCDRDGKPYALGGITYAIFRGLRGKRSV